ncbi:MAG: ABC transporter permease [Leptolinea sp.]|jgi:ribose transport system permease protein|nr:ABC transporter permease [Leptolinea sp.]
MINTKNQNQNRITSIFRSVFSISGIGVIIAFTVLVMYLSLASPNFLTTSNIMIVIRQAVFVALMAIGMTFIIAEGAIDLSVGATLGISGIMVAALILAGVNIYLAVVITLLFGILIGLINGLLVTQLHMPYFIATLGTLSIMRGLILMYTNGIPLYGLRFPEFQYLAQGFIGPIPVPIFILFAALLIFLYVMNRTKLGRYTLAIGTNREAARLVGINIPKIELILFSLTGFLSALAGILLTSRTEAAVPTAGSGYELDVIAAVVIGGTSMTGGKANLIGTIIGAILMTTIRNGLNLLGINALLHQVVIGIFILIAVGIDSRISTKKS